MDVLHGDVVGAVGLAELVDLGDVRVVEARGEQRLVPEHLHELPILGEVREDALHHDVLGEPLNARLARKPHLGHAAGGELLDELIFPKRLRVHPGWLAGGSKREVESVRAVHPRPPAGVRQRRLMGNHWFPLVASVLLATSAAADPLQEPTDQVNVDPRDDLLELSWSDAEERLQGSISPAVPREGEPLKVIVRLGRFEGTPFEGPITFTLREAGSTHGQTVTVPHGEQHWQATFTPENDGPHLLDVSFRTTRYKALHTPLQVWENARVPRLLGWGVLGLGALVLLGYSVRSQLRGERPEEPAPSEAPPSMPLPENPAAATSAGPEAEAPPSPESPATAAPPPGPETPPAPASESAPAEQAAPSDEPTGQ